jgi:hypothetical protein
MMELAGSEVNHENAGPERDEVNNRILSASKLSAIRDLHLHSP